jgi:hypothetical protein
VIDPTDNGTTSSDHAEDVLFELEDAILKVCTAAELMELAHSAPGSMAARGYAAEKVCEEIAVLREEFRRLRSRDPMEWRGSGAPDASSESTKP